jgi:hypothetical protein
MMPPTLIPGVDPNPLPAPYWLLNLLLIVTFVLHILAMDFMLGGGVVALLTKLRTKNSEAANRIFLDLAKKMPVLLPAAITLGIAPLLFVQVLYGQFFYTSSILMAWPWFLVLVLLTVAYYGFYYVSFRSGRNPGRASGVMLFSVTLVLLIGFLFTNNITLSQTPARWGAKYFASAGGWHLNLSEPVLVPRFLHFLIAAVAVGGLLLVFMALANWKRDREYAGQLLELGGKTFMYATMAQIVAGIVFLISLPRDMRMLFMGDDPLATTLLLIGVAGGIGAIVLMSDALRRQNVRAAAVYVPAIVGVVIVCMSIMRDTLRNAYLKPYFQPGQFAVRTQWSVLPLFLVLFVAGVTLWFVMLRRYGLLGSRKSADRPAATGS